MRISELRYYKSYLIGIFAFLLGCMITINLTPIEKTCRIEDSDREYNIMQNSKLKNPELIVIILSGPKNLDKRNVIRETWLTLNRETGFRAKHYFAIGSFSLSNDDILHLTSEQSRYNDILVLPLHDSYNNLTEKVAKSFEWLAEQYNYGLGFKYVLKCDDDSFINLKIILQELETLEKVLNTKHLDLLNKQYITTNFQINQFSNESLSMELYWGYFNGNAHIKTKGKWKERNWIACDRYIPYALGGGYLLSRNLVLFIAQNVNYLRFHNSEDVSVGAWLAPVNNILRVHDVRFDTEWISRGCQNFNLIRHNISKKEMLEMYENLIKGKQLCLVESLKRNFYRYNWTNPPSQCCK